MALNIDSYIVQKLNDMRVNGVMCDLELVAEDGACVLVHSAVWVAAFEDPFCLREMGKEYTLSSNQLDIFGVSGSVLVEVVDFIYGNKVKPTDELTGALDKFGMKDWLKYLPTSKCPRETNYRKEKAEAKENTVTNTNVHSTCMTPVISTSVKVKVEKDTDNMEGNYTQEQLGGRKRKLSEKDLSECENKKLDLDLSIVKSEPLSPDVPQCSSESFTDTNSMSTSSTVDSEHGTIVKEEPFDDMRSPASQIHYGAKENCSEELTKQSSETILHTGPVVLNVRSLADNPSFGNSVPQRKSKGAAKSARKTNKMPTSFPRKLQTLLPKQPEMKNLSSEKPSSLPIDDQSCSTGNTLMTTRNKPCDQTTPSNHSANFTKDSASTLLKGTNGRPGPEPVKLFLNNSNMNSLQFGVPWNIIVNGNATDALNIKSSSSLFFPTSTSNVATTTTTSTSFMCTSVGAPVAIRAMKPGQNTVTKNSNAVQSSYNAITLPVGAFPNMQNLGADQRPNVIGNNGPRFVKPIAIGSPVVSPMSLTNSLTTGPVIGNFGCQVLQNSTTATVSPTNPAGVTSTAPLTNTALQNDPTAVNVVNKQLGHLVFVNSGTTGNRQMTTQFSFVGPPQTSSVPSTNVLSSLPYANTPTGFGSLQNVIGSPQTNAGIIAGTPVQFKGDANVSPQLTYTAKQIPSSSTVPSPKFTEGKIFDKSSNSEEKSHPDGEIHEKQDSSSETESRYYKHNIEKNSEADQQEHGNLNINPTDDERPFVIDLNKEDAEDDVNPIEILVKKTIRTIKTKKIPTLLKKTALQFQNIDPVTKSPMYAPVSVTRASPRKLAGRKKIAMIGRHSSRRKESTIDSRKKESTFDSSQFPVRARRRGRPPKNHQNTDLDLIGPISKDNISKRSSSKRKSESPKSSNEHLDDSLLSKFRPIAPKSFFLQQLK